MWTILERWVYIDIMMDHGVFKVSCQILWVRLPNFVIQDAFVIDNIKRRNARSTRSMSMTLRCPIADWLSWRAHNLKVSTNSSWRRRLTSLLTSSIRWWAARVFCYTQQFLVTNTRYQQHRVKNSQHSLKFPHKNDIKGKKYKVFNFGNKANVVGEL